MCFKTNYFTNSSYIPQVIRPLLLRNIHISKPELKLTNDKVQINIHTVNIEKITFLQKSFLLRKDLAFFAKNLKLITFELLSNLPNAVYVPTAGGPFPLPETGALFKPFSQAISSHLKIYMLKYLFIKKKISFLIWKIRKKEYLNYLNIFKFDKEQFLDKLTIILNKMELSGSQASKPRQKLILYNIINVKAFAHNPSIFTNILALKLKKPLTNLVTAMEGLVRRLRIPTRQWDYANNLSYIYDIFANKHKNNYLVNRGAASNLKEKSIYRLLQNVYKKDPLNKDKEFSSVMDLIFKKLRLKHMLGIRIEVKGRLTKRYRADRAIYKLGWKGGLKNYASSFLKKRFITYRGPISSSQMYSIQNSTRKIGAFAVKGWASTKL